MSAYSGSSSSRKYLVAPPKIIQAQNPGSSSSSSSSYYNTSSRQGSPASVGTYHNYNMHGSNGSPVHHQYRDPAQDNARKFVHASSRLQSQGREVEVINHGKRTNAGEYPETPRSSQATSYDYRRTNNTRS